MAIKTPTAEQYNSALVAHGSIARAIESLQAVRSHVVNKDILKHIKFTIAGLLNESFIHAKVIGSVELSVNTIDAGLAGIAKNRVKELADLLRLNRGSITRKQRAFELGAGNDPVTDADIVLVTEERAALEAELSKINEFLQDGDKSRLVGTALEGFVNG